MIEVKTPTEIPLEFIDTERGDAIQGRAGLDSFTVKWSWSCRGFCYPKPENALYIQRDERPPRVGDAALMRIDRVGHHARLDTASGGRLRLYSGDDVGCVFGNRYATDVYEGRVRGLDRLHLFTSSGLAGTVASRHRNVSRPTAVSFLGYIVNGMGVRVNTKELFFRPVVGSSRPDLILVVGTGMNTGKTTVMRKLLRGLLTRGVKVAACKLTGTASPRDLREYESTGPIHSMDFSDFGLPSTSGATTGELLQLLDSMLEVCGRKGADVVVMEIADGFLQRETQFLLQSERVRRLTCGVVLSASCSGSALGAMQCLEEAGFNAWAVSGLITNSPLFVREFRRRSPVPVVESYAGSQRLAETILNRLEKHVHQLRESAAAS